jgi:hypothetical protein
LSLSRSITACLHSPTRHDTSLTIISSLPLPIDQSINQSIINRHNTHTTYYLTGALLPRRGGIFLDGEFNLALLLHMPHHRGVCVPNSERADHVRAFGKWRHVQLRGVLLLAGKPAALLLLCC